MNMKNSGLISSDLTTAIKENKNKIKTSREKRYKEKSCIIREQLNENLRRLHDITQEKGVTNWLTVLPIAEKDFNLNKQQFWDAIRLRYGWNIPNLATHYTCGSKYDVQHSLSCKKRWICDTKTQFITRSNSEHTQRSL